MNKQRAWLEAYLTCWNATEAARRAGYAQPRMAGSRMMTNDNIRAAIAERLAEQHMAADEVLARLAEHARGDMGAFFKIVEAVTDAPLPTQEVLGTTSGFDPDGNPLTLYRVRQVTIDRDRLLDPRYSRLIRRFTDSPKSGLSVELYDAQAALEKIGKHLGLFKVTEGEGLGDALARVLERLAGAARPADV